MENSILKLITAYWCNGATGNREQRFFWAYEKVDEIVHEVGPQARSLLLLLSRSAPGEYATSLFAAGPLEDYVNVVLDNKLADEAAFIVNDDILNQMLSEVWSDIDSLRSLAAHSSSRSSAAPIDLGLRFLDPKEAAGFWCQTCTSSAVDEYKEAYDRVIAKLLDSKTREKVTQDLLLTAPDKQAEELLHSNIFALHK